MGIFDRLDRLADQLGDLIVPDDVRAHVELGAAYLDRGDLESATRELALATELRPDHTRAAYLLGIAHARRGDDDAAIESLMRAATGRGALAQAHLALGEIYRRRGDIEAAADSYRAALDMGLDDPTLRAEVYRGLGAVYLAAGRFDKAVRELRKAVASAPEDGEAQALLGRSLYLRGDLDAARLCLERAARGRNADPRAVVALGELYERTGRLDEARIAYERTVEFHVKDAEVSARLGLARLTLATGGPVHEAHEQALRALGLEPDRPDIIAMLGRVSAAANSYEAALSAFDRALVAGAGVSTREKLLFDRRPVLEDALRTAVRGGLFARAVPYADALLADRPEHAEALAALSLAASLQGDTERAAELATRAAAAGDTVEVRLAQAEVAMARAQPFAAAASLRRAAQLAPAHPRPRERLAELYRAQREAGPRDLYALLKASHRHFAHCRELSELSPEAGRLVEVLDRPLLVTVMGEFNSGKSTFVNALLGEEVAPMGITPTTATINVLKYGDERKGRVVYLDDTHKDVPWDKVPALLRGISADEARRIRMVEVLYPLETLQRVNVVDTPGLNSIMPEHEETARRFIAEGDAVVWLFTVDQAAKATEGEALGKVHAAGKKVLGVLNKIDRCTPDELDQIVKHVTGALGDQLETVVPFAAREALQARKANDPERLERARYGELTRTLEERFFSRSRAIKHAAACVRLRGLLDRGRALGEALLLERPTEQLTTALASVRAEAVIFERQFLDAERRRLNLATDDVYLASAREVLDFVRPRRWAFGTNEAAPADRDFLLTLIDERLGALLDASRARAWAEAERALALLRGVDPDLDTRAHEQAQLLDQQVYGRYRAFARGYLRGGRVDDFFTRVLPKLELSEAAIRRALERGGPWSDEIAESELRAPLRAWGQKFYAALIDRLDHIRTTAELDRFDVEERVIAPLDALASSLQELCA